jgi:hypothetical protein
MLTMEDRRHERELTDRSEESLLSAPRVRVYQEKIKYNVEKLALLKATTSLFLKYIGIL